MAFMWTVLLLTLWDITYGYKLPRGEFKDSDTYSKVPLRVEDPSAVNSTAANLLHRLSRNVTNELDHNVFKGQRVRREVTEEDYSLLEEMTTESEDNQTTEAFTMKTGVMHDNATIELNHQTDILSTEAGLNSETSPTFVTHSTIQDIASTTNLDIFEIVTSITSTHSLTTSQITNPTQQTVTENRTANLSTDYVEPGIRSTATPVSTLTTTSLLNPGLVDTLDPTTPTLGLTNKENSQPEKQNIMDSLMVQCLLAISILAFIAMAFIICTIVLATKLSRLRNNYKLLTQNSTEMVCISSLLPENDQQAGKTKVKASKLKTFVANVDDGEGDTLTLNSFLPDH